MGKIYVVGIGPGNLENMTLKAKEVIEKCDIIVGYKTYTGLIKKDFPDKDFYENGMRGETERCEKCVEFAEAGKTVALISSGDAGVYGMASLMLEIAEKKSFKEVEVISGVTAALSGSAELGAPLSHDFCVISLSDLLTPAEVIKKRLRAAAEGDFCIAVYNPSSSKRPDHLKKMCEFLLTMLPEDTACGYVKNLGREGCVKKVCTLKELYYEETDMFTTVFIGNSETRIFDGRLITPRGYRL